MPLDAQSECGSSGDAYRFDRAVLGHPFQDNAIAKLEDGLTMQRVHADLHATKESGEYAVGHEPYLMAIGEHDLRIAMKTSISCAWRTMVHAPRKVPHANLDRSILRGS
jgi:head-tail adaptor